MQESNSKEITSLYHQGLSTPQIAARTGNNISRVRSILIDSGVQFRTRSEALKIREGLGTHAIGKPRVHSEETKRKLSEKAKIRAEENAIGVTLKQTGYLEITTGDQKGMRLHVAIMEERIGRRIRPDEVVHHIDRNKLNNDINNLALMTRAAHTRLHRFEDKLEGIQRERENGRFA